MRVGTTLPFCALPFCALPCPVTSVQSGALTARKCICVHAASANEYEQGDGEKSNEGDDKEGCETPAALGGASTEAPPAAKRSSNFLFSKPSKP